MKKLIIVFLVLCLSMTVVAQNQIKRVAILETVDKEGTVSYMKLLQFRSNLTTAITNTEGYEGYDRADLEQIIGEHNFQRTGLVSDADIKKIGEFTGAQYVLIAEAAIDGTDMFITAKIIDVESARVLRNSNQLMGTSAAEMQEGSKKVAADLLGISVSKNDYSQPSHTVQESDEILRFTEDMPTYPGGSVALSYFLSNEIKYPQVALNKGIKGTVLIEFVVEKDGSVNNEKVIVSLSPECDAEAIRGVRAMPRWNPGRNSKGRPVRCYMQIPITFRP